MSRLWSWLVLLVGALGFAGVASAQTSSFEGMMNQIIRGAPGVTNVSVTNGISSSVVGNISVAAGAGSVTVPTTATATVGLGAIARGAARIGVRAIPWVGTAIVVAEVANSVGGSGITTCPPPAFFCKPQSKPGDTIQVNGKPQYRYCSSTAGCNIWRDAVGDAQGDYCPAQVTWNQNNGYPNVVGCRLTDTGSANNGWVISYIYKFKDGSEGSAGTRGPSIQYVCPDGKIQATIGCTVANPDTTVMVPADVEDINKVLSDKANADRNWALGMKAKLDAVTQANPALEPVVEVATAPLTVTAPVTTGPSTVVSTKTIPNADGSTSTETVTQQVKISPQSGTPSTVTSPNVTWPATTTTTTTVVNNVTNKTETTVKVDSAPAAPKPADVKIPDDYNREVTQQRILGKLEEAFAPITATAPKGDDEIASIKAQNDKGVAAVDGITEASTGIRGWFPTIPTAACVNPMVPIPVSGGSIAVPICDKVDIFRVFISAVICVFALFGCVREVQTALKA